MVSESESESLWWQSTRSTCWRSESNREHRFFVRGKVEIRLRSCSTIADWSVARKAGVTAISAFCVGFSEEFARMGLSIRKGLVWTVSTRFTPPRKPLQTFISVETNRVRKATMWPYVQSTSISLNMMLKDAHYSSVSLATLAAPSSSKSVACSMRCCSKGLRGCLSGSLSAHIVHCPISRPCRQPVSSDLVESPEGLDPTLRCVLGEKSAIFFGSCDSRLTVNVTRLWTVAALRWHNWAPDLNLQPVLVWAQQLTRNRHVEANEAHGEGKWDIRASSRHVRIVPLWLRSCCSLTNVWETAPRRTKLRRVNCDG